MIDILLSNFKDLIYISSILIMAGGTCISFLMKFVRKSEIYGDDGRTKYLPRTEFKEVKDKCDQTRKEEISDLKEQIYDKIDDHQEHNKELFELIRKDVQALK